MFCICRSFIAGCQSAFKFALQRRDDLGWRKNAADGQAEKSHIKGCSPRADLECGHTLAEISREADLHYATGSRIYQGAGATITIQDVSLHATPVTSIARSFANRGGGKSMTLVSR